MMSKPINAVAFKRKLQQAAEKRMESLPVDEQTKLLRMKYGHLTLKNNIEYRSIKRSPRKVSEKRGKYRDA